MSQCKWKTSLPKAEEEPGCPEQLLDKSISHRELWYRNTLIKLDSREASQWKRAYALHKKFVSHFACEYEWGGLWTLPLAEGMGMK